VIFGSVIGSSLEKDVMEKSYIKIGVLMLALIVLSLVSSSPQA
jgi:hypothetical protein